MLKCKFLALTLVFLAFALSHAASAQTERNQILYIAYPDGVPTFMATDIDGSHTRILGTAILEENAEIMSMALSPDQRYIVVSSRKDRDGSGFSSEDILLLDVQTGEFNSLISDGHYDELGHSYPAWSPDSTHIAYMRGGGDNGAGEVLIMDVRTRQTTLVAGGNNRFRGLIEADSGMSFRGVAWSPDGDKLLLTGITGLPDVKNPVVLINVDGASPRLAAPLDIRVAAGVDWSPEDTNIFYAGCDMPDETTRLCQINISNLQVAPLVDSSAVPGFPTTIPRRIAVSDEGAIVLLFGLQDAAIYGLDPATSTLTPLASGGPLALVGWVSPSFTISPIIGEVTATTAVETLRDMLTSASCNTSCFLGIEPGVTTQDELEAILDSLPASYQVLTVGNAGLITRYVVTADVESRLIAEVEHPFGVALGGSTVEIVDISLSNVSVADVVESFGSPESVGFSGRNTLVYPALGLIFFVQDDGQMVDEVHLRTPDSIAGTYADLASCVGHSAVCDLSTSTPTPPISTDTPTENPDDPLNLLACGVGCYYGLIPGVSTERDLLSLLSRKNAAFSGGPLGFSGAIMVYNFGPLNHERYIEQDRDAISIDVGGELVEAIYIFRLRNVTVADVVGAYGAPSSITHDGSTVMIYAHYGLLFMVDDENQTDIRYVEIAAAGEESSRLAYFLTWTPCDIADPECAIAAVTATPTLAP